MSVYVRICSLSIVASILASTDSASAHPRAPQPARGPTGADGRAVALTAMQYLERKRTWMRRRDCSGFVEAVLAVAGAPTRGNTRSFYVSARREGRVRSRPQPGDLAFFDRTHDANRNGRVDDPLSHIAIVTRVHEDGRVEMVHRGSRGVRRLRLHLNQPARHRLEGQVVNDYLRARNYGSRRGPRLAGQLLRGFARPAGVDKVDVAKPRVKTRVPSTPRSSPARLRAPPVERGRPRHELFAAFDELFPT